MRWGTHVSVSPVSNVLAASSTIDWLSVDMATNYLG
jgi:hypothetical protein